jgi:S-adenosylmethionine:tRNA-ribosyltransferase-isomerase (queuine synthetase)
VAVSRAGKSFSDERFYNFPQFLKKGDVVVLNNTKFSPRGFSARPKPARESSFF